MTCMFLVLSGYVFVNNILNSPLSTSLFQHLQLLYTANVSVAITTFCARIILNMLRYKKQLNATGGLGPRRQIDDGSEVYR